MKHQFILTAYDISEAGRLAKARAQITEWAHGGQKSVLECFVSAYERPFLEKSLYDKILTQDDKLAFFLPPGGDRNIRILGCATTASDDPLIYIG